MHKEQAITEATKVANEQNLTMSVHCDPVGQGEQDGYDQPWGYCPLSHVYIIARHREAEHDITIHPQPVKPCQKTT
jgi:hypothetical protein